MSEQHEQDGKQDETIAEDIVQSKTELPGRHLREQRESSHLSLEEVAHHLHLDVELIKALEADDYSRLPSPAYICGYLRSYARLLKLPEDEIVRAYNHGEQINAALIPSTVNIATKKPVNTGLIKTVVVLIVVVLVLGGLYLVGDKFDLFSADSSKKSRELKIPATSETTDQQTSVPAEVPASKTQAPLAESQDTPQGSSVPAKVETGKTVVENLPTPKSKIPDVPTSDAGQQTPATAVQTRTTTPSATQTQQATSSVNSAQLRLHFNGDSWTEVTDSTGNRLVYHLIEKNTDLDLKGQPPFTILLGNAPEVQVFFKGKEIDHTRYRRGDTALFKVGVK